MIGTSFFVVVAAALAMPAHGADQHSKDLQAQFQQEPDPVRRAKLMVRISREDFSEIRKFLAAQDNAGALKLLGEFQDDATTCESQLNARQKNPEAHPAGFKDLQIAVRESLRRLDDLMPGLTSDEQPPFQAARADLDQMNRRLIRVLFPHQPLPDEPEEKP